MFFGCTTANHTLPTQECINNAPPSNLHFRVALALSMAEKSQAAYTLGYSDMLVEQMLFDDFYLYYEVYEHYESGCSPYLDYQSLKSNFKNFARSSMVSGRRYVDDPYMAITKDYSRKILEMNIYKIFKLVDMKYGNENNKGGLP